MLLFKESRADALKGLDLLSNSVRAMIFLKKGLSDNSVGWSLGSGETSLKGLG